MEIFKNGTFFPPEFQIDGKLPHKGCHWQQFPKLQTTNPSHLWPVAPRHLPGLAFNGNWWIVGKVNPSIHCKLVESLQTHPQMMFTELFQPILQFSVRFLGSCMLCFFIFSDFQLSTTRKYLSTLSWALPFTARAWGKHWMEGAKALITQATSARQVGCIIPGVSGWWKSWWKCKALQWVHFIGCHMMGI